MLCNTPSSEKAMSHESYAPNRARTIINTCNAGESEPGLIERREQARTLHEMRVDAMLALVTDPRRSLFDANAAHRMIEAYAASEHQNLPYYERWLKAIRAVMVEHGVLTEAEIEAGIAAIKARGTAGGPPC
jgi:hypothetical protein